MNTVVTVGKKYVYEEIVEDCGGSQYIHFGKLHKLVATETRRGSLSSRIRFSINITLDLLAHVNPDLRSKFTRSKLSLYMTKLITSFTIFQTNCVLVILLERYLC